VSSQAERARALIDEHGRTFAEELGLDVAKDTPGPLFGLLVASLLLSTRINSELALSASRELRSAGLTSARKVLEADDQVIWDALERGRYLRKDRTTPMLRETAQLADAKYDGDLRRLRTEADGDAGRAADLVREFKGIGAVGAEIFLREVQVAWPELAPFAGSRALAAAPDHDLPGDTEKLAALVGPDEFPRLAAALVRSRLEGG